MTAIFRIVSYVLALAIAVIVVVFATSNRTPVSVDLWPLPYQVDLPLYVMSLGALAIGIILGASSGWISALRARRRAWLGSRRAARLERELEAAREKVPPRPGGGILARRRAAAEDD